MEEMDACMNEHLSTKQHGITPQKNINFVLTVLRMLYCTVNQKTFISELAATYKEDGNYNFKIKKYRLAIMSYTEGLKQRCGDSLLESELYNNRAAAHFFLKNYR
jgi:hypothetical protein